MVHREVSQYAGLNLDLLRVSLPLHLVAGLELLLGHDTQAFKHINALLVEIALEDLRTALLNVQTTLLGFEYPFVRVAIAVETDRLTGLDVFTQHIDDGMELGAVFCTGELLFKLRNLGIHTLLEVH